MMFMIPMPPTTRATAATLARSSIMVRWDTTRVCVVSMG
jgi:hypothetical protein